MGCLINLVLFPLELTIKIFAVIWNTIFGIKEIVKESKRRKEKTKKLEEKKTNRHLELRTSNNVSDEEIEITIKEKIEGGIGMIPEVTFDMIDDYLDTLNGSKDIEIQFVDRRNNEISQFNDEYNVVRFLNIIKEYGENSTLFKVRILVEEDCEY